MQSHFSFLNWQVQKYCEFRGSLRTIPRQFSSLEGWEGGGVPSLQGRLLHHSALTPISELYHDTVQWSGQGLERCVQQNVISWILQESWSLEARLDFHCSYGGEFEN